MDRSDLFTHQRVVPHDVGKTSRGRKILGLGKVCLTSKGARKRAIEQPTFPDRHRARNDG